ETAGVTLVKASPEVSKDALYQREGRPNNLLRWDLEVEPNRSGERAVAINYEFRLELDRNMAITGLLSRGYGFAHGQGRSVSEGEASVLAHAAALSARETTFHPRGPAWRTFSGTGITPTSLSRTA